MFNFVKNIFNKDNSKTKERVVRFKDRHALGLDCYNASDLELRYGRFYMKIYDSEDYDGKRDLAGPKEDKSYIADATMGLFEVFRDVVKLNWLDYEGNPIEYEFRFEDIFKDKIIPHKKEDEDLIFWSDPLGGTPGIIIEVDNRTLNIYLDADILLEIPNSNRLKSRHDKILVFSKTF